MQFYLNSMAVSVNNLAERKYKNIKPWLIHCVGQAEPKKSVENSKIYKSKQQKEDNVTPPVKFNSIPAVCFLPQSQHIVTSEFASPNSPTCRVQILNKKGILVHSFPTSVHVRGTSSFGVASATDQDTDLAICSGDGIGLWTTEGKLRSHLQHQDVQNCCHINRLRNGLLATTCITEMRGRCVTLWDPRSGKIASQFGSRPEIIDINPLKATQRILIRNHHIRLPWFLASNSKNEIFISDRNAKCIKVFDTRKGAYLKHFDPCGLNTRAKKTLLPQGICVDENDNVIVADNFTNSIQVFDPHGEFVKTLPLNTDPNYGEPWAIAMTTEPQFPDPICRSKCKGHDDARTFVVSVATPKPVLNIYKLSFCPHYTSYV